MPDGLLLSLYSCDLCAPAVPSLTLPDVHLLQIQDTPGHGDHINIWDAIRGMTRYVQQQNRLWLVSFRASDLPADLMERCVVEEAPDLMLRSSPCIGLRGRWALHK